MRAVEEAQALCRAIGREVDRLTAITEEYLRFARLPRPETGLGLYARLGLAAAHKYSGAQSRRKVGLTIDFQVDPQAPHGVRNMPAFAMRK